MDDNYILSTVDLFNNDFDQSSAGFYIQRTITIDSSNLDNLAPQFADQTTENYHLKKSSPCIDAGTSVGAPDTDIDGDLRPQGEGFDIGADEYLVTPPAADFTVSRATGFAPLTIQYTDQSAGIITSWEWDFGDGNVSTEQNPVHTYMNAGDYTVMLTVAGPGGSDSETKTSFISVSLQTWKAMPWIPLLLLDD